MADEDKQPGTTEPTNGKIKPNSPLAGATIGAIVAWTWNLKFPDAPMPAEVAAPVGALLGPVIRWCVAWLPEPQHD